MDLKKINSITKYPSIYTYHQLGERGRLNDALTESRGFEESESVYIYEKVDGENSRIIMLKNAEGDRIGNPYGNIADFLRPIADEIIANDQLQGEWALKVIYQESYGGKTKASKHYSDRNTQNYRVFDVFSLNKVELDNLMELQLEKIAEWREHGNQPFYNEDDKQRLVQRLGLQAAPLLEVTTGSHFPISLEDTFSNLKKFEKTQVGIELAGKSEGIIVRTVNRNQIRKIRFEDYERTFRN
ncbi:hypothetical protein J2W91_001122 [Paenibacillus amylolyticus]|uniref:RNA ligase domain-containing protein n=1 Tax=Paenibacillus amylolyticus TaxID=1451 RepID=A0AAP5LPN2_PAEAM|nr:RNA ligase family protein [Paenibacillus amylolyticus]MDR6722674.1 hypothetical protein [Paenibacillus amylolyticus]